MRRELLHIYGPFSINSYGLAIACGIIILLLLALRHPLRKKIIASETFIETVLFGIVLGIIGGRALYVVTNWQLFDSIKELFQIWDGGFSIFGSIIAIITILPLYLKKRGIPILSFFDVVTLYALLLEAIARIGCFSAGCCYGIPTTLPWGVIYTDPQTMAPRNVCIHPTQLYSSALLLFFFLVLHFGLQKKLLLRPGKIFMAYLMFESTARFTVDFLRADREFFSSAHFAFLSIHQWLALGIFVAAALGFCILTACPTQKNTPADTHS